MCQEFQKSRTFDPTGDFESPSEAVKQVMQQPSPIASLMQVVRANVEADEIGFAYEVIIEYGVMTV